MTELELLNELIEKELQLSKTGDHKLRSDINGLKDELREFPDKSSSTQALGNMINTLRNFQKACNNKYMIIQKYPENKGLLIHSHKLKTQIHSKLTHTLQNPDFITLSENIVIDTTRILRDRITEFSLEHYFKNNINLLRVLNQNPNFASLSEFIKSIKP